MCVQGQWLGWLGGEGLWFLLFVDGWNEYGRIFIIRSCTPPLANTYYIPLSINAPSEALEEVGEVVEALQLHLQLALLLAW